MTYTDRVLAVHPADQLAYWPMTETSGTVAEDASGNGRAGTYHTVTLGVPGIGDGSTGASFNGTDSVLDVWSANLAAALTPDEFTMSLWFKVSLEVWTNGQVGRLFTWQVDAGNRVMLQKSSAANTLQTFSNAGGTNKTRTVSSYSPVYWTHWALTVSKSANAMKVYLSGAQNGATITGIGTWAGTLPAESTVIGAQNLTVPVNVLSGSLAHMVVWNRVLTAGEIAALAVADATEPAATFTARARALAFTAQARSLAFTARAR